MILVSSGSFVSSVSSESFVSPISLYVRDPSYPQDPRDHWYPCILEILVIPGFLGILVSSVSSGSLVSSRFLVSLFPRDPCILGILGILCILGILSILEILAMFQCRYPAETWRDIQQRLLPARCFFDYRGCGSEREAAFSCLLYQSCRRALIHK